MTQRFKHVRQQHQCGILLYFPENKRFPPSYLVSTHVNGALWKSNDHYIPTPLNEAMVMYETNSDYGKIKRNPYMVQEFGPIIVGPIQQYETPGPIQGALEAYHRYLDLQPCYPEVKEHVTSLLSNEEIQHLYSSNCAHCSKSNARKKCGRCRTHYCDRNCQTKHWSRHKSRCNILMFCKGIQ